MPRSRGQLGVRNPDVHLLLPRLTRVLQEHAARRMMFSRMLRRSLAEGNDEEMAIAAAISIKIRN